MRIAPALLLCFALACCGGHSKDVEAPVPRRADHPRIWLQASENATFEVVELVTGLERPWGLAFLPDGAILVTERPGRLRLLSAAGAVSAPLSGLPRIFTAGQAGLLDVAISPGFAQDRLVYLAYAEPNLRGNLAGTAVARGRLEGEALIGVEVVYRQEPKRSSGTHVGARLVFDDAGHLFITQGDNRVAADEAQQLDKLAGKLVRVNADGTIPDDNPFVGRADARPEIWSFGHRNIQGAALHPRTRRLWTSEHGPMGGDEVNIPLAGRNYGWPLITHGRDYSGAPVKGALGRAAKGMEQPHHVWEVSPAVSGMAFYDGPLFPGWQGDLFVGALAQRALIRLELVGDRVVSEERLLGELGMRIRDVRSGPDGALYLLVDDDNGALLLIRPANRIGGDSAASNNASQGPPQAHPGAHRTGDGGVRVHAGGLRRVWRAAAA